MRLYILLRAFWCILFHKKHHALQARMYRMDHWGEIFDLHRCGKCPRQWELRS